MVATLVVEHVQKPLIVLAGPTASGKTALAIHLAQQFSGEVVSCDSVTVYRGMEIGSAKPTPEERELVPHHLIDVAWPDEQVTAGDYSRLAREALTGISERGNLPIVAGGTGALPARPDRRPLPRPQGEARAARTPARTRRDKRDGARSPHPQALRPGGGLCNPLQRPAQDDPRHRGLPRKRGRRRAPAHDRAVAEGPRPA